MNESPAIGDGAGLEAFFSPRSVAVIGASRNPGKLGHDVLVESARRGFAGQMFAVNPNARGDEIAGWPAFRSLSEVPVPVDLVLVATPASATLDAVESASRAGVRAAVLAAAGFGELGAEGAFVEERIAGLARAAGMRLLGPNGFGLFVDRIGLNLTGWHEIPTGKVALVTQSGNVAIALCRMMTRTGVGLSACVGLGNQIDVGVGEVVARHARSDDSDAVAVYLEGLRNEPGERFAEALETCRRNHKPVVVLKAGSSPAGSRSVTTHTGALAGDRRLFRAVLAEHGAISVDDPEELVDVLSALRAQRTGQRRPRGGRRPGAGVLVLSDGGGDSVLAVDALESAGVPLAALSPATQAELDRLAPVAAPRAKGANPVTLDTAGGLEEDPRLLARCAEAGAGDGAVEAIVVSGTFGGYRRRRAEELEAAERLSAVSKAGLPVLVHSGFALDDEEPLRLLVESGVPVFATARRLANALSKVVAHGAAGPYDGAGAEAPPPEDQKVLPVTETAELLSAAGVVLPALEVARDEAELASVLDHACFPVCMKVEDPSLVHKSDAGGVVLDISAAGAPGAARSLWQRFPGAALLVMPMLPPGIELLVGAAEDTTFGPYVTVGRGGTAAELDPDVAIGTAPISAGRARELWSSLRCAPLLEGWRGGRGADLAVLVELTVAFGRLVVEHEGLSLECNPVIAYPDGYAVADLRGVRRVGSRAKGGGGRGSQPEVGRAGS